MSIAVLGAGSWGTALAIILADNGHHVRLWARDRHLLHALRERHENPRYLPGFPLPDRITPAANLADATRDVEVVVFAVPSGSLREVAQMAAPHIPAPALLLSAAKGLEEGTGLRMSQVLSTVIPHAEQRVVALSGPNLAVEVARKLPTASVAASTCPEAARRIQQLFSTQPCPTFRVYTNHDIVGVELGGAIKNVIAIGAGVCDGLGFGDNSKAAFLTRGLTETIRLGVAQGAEARTFLGLSGAGDLFATSASRLSRNYRVGYALGQGRPLQEALQQIGQAAEGIPTTHALCTIARRAHVDMPLCNAIYALLFEGRSAPDVIRELMLRPLKAEVEPL